MLYVTMVPESKTKGENNMALNRTKCAVLKKGKLLMANATKARTFKTRKTAKAFITNQIWLSKKLMPGDFRFIPVSE